MYKLPKLDFEYDALGQYISADIMKLHHGKHHQAYVDKLNAALAEHPEFANASLQELLTNSVVPQVIHNNAGGHYNHSLFWQWLAAKGGGEPTDELSAAIKERYGSFQQFADVFSDTAAGVFGSGWVWLQPDMTIITTANQDTPMMAGLSEPVLGLDVWEHAYYLDYKNVRADYIKAWWNVVNWDFAEQRYRELRSGTK